MFSIASVVYAWDNQLAYAQALVADLTDQQMIARPGGAMNHPAWIFGHLGAYHPIIVDLLYGAPVTDAKDDPLYGFAGHGPLDQLEPYGTKQSIIDRFSAGHEKVALALLEAKPADLARKPSLERWAAKYPTVEFMLPDLMLHHESLHIGQVSIWRRAAGLPAVKLPDRTIRPGLTPG